MAKQQLFTLSELARHKLVGYGRTWLTAARKCSPGLNGREPLKFSHGRRTQLKPVLEWVRLNPDFVEREVFRRRPRGGPGRPRPSPPPGV